MSTPTKRQQQLARADEIERYKAALRSQLLRAKRATKSAEDAAAAALKAAEDAKAATAAAKELKPAPIVVKESKEPKEQKVSKQQIIKAAPMMMDPEFLMYAQQFRQLQQRGHGGGCSGSSCSGCCPHNNNCCAANCASCYRPGSYLYGYGPWDYDAFRVWQYQQQRLMSDCYVSRSPCGSRVYEVCQGRGDPTVVYVDYQPPPTTTRVVESMIDPTPKSFATSSPAGVALSRLFSSLS